MLSLETAKRLKEAGIEPWFELYYVANGEAFARFQFEQEARWYAAHLRIGSPVAFGMREVYSADQLLAEIERRECWYSLARESGGDNYSLMLWKAHCRIEIFYAATAAQAAAQALLWILEREAGSERKNGAV